MNVIFCVLNAEKRAGTVEEFLEFFLNEFRNLLMRGFSVAARYLLGWEAII